MNLLYDLRGLRYDTLFAGVPLNGSLQVGCAPLVAGVGRVCAPAEDGLVGLKGGRLGRTVVGEQPQLLTTNFNARIQYLFHSRLDRAQKVKRSVRCEACDITLNSELQAKQHYKGKFHQRKLRQQTEKPMGTNDTSTDATQCVEKLGGLKRSSDDSSEDSGGHVAKLIRKEIEIETGQEESNPQHGASGSTTSSTEPVTSPSEVSASLAAEAGDRNDATKMEEVPGINDACRDVNEACRASNERERRSRELEISVRVKNSHKSTATRIIHRPPMSMPAAGGLRQFHPLPAPRALPNGMFLAPHPLVACHSIPLQSSLIPWQGPWVHPNPSQPTLHTHGLSFNATTCGSQNSTRCLTSGFAVPSNTATEVNVTSGLQLPFAFLQRATPTQSATALCKSLVGVVNTDKEFVSGQGRDLTAIALSNQTRSSWQQRRPDLTELRQPVGVVCSRDLDRLDPVSRAVYSNFLGHFTTKTSRTRPGRLR